MHDAMEPDEFVRLLTERLRAILPPGFCVSVTDGTISYSTDSGRFPGQQGDYQVGETGVYIPHDLGALLTTDADAFTCFVWQALDTLQDYIDEATHGPWPGSTSPPRAFAELDGATLLFGYRDEVGVVTVCEPIRFPGPADSD